jgi:hypothetical protein
LKVRSIGMLTQALKHIPYPRPAEPTIKRALILKNDNGPDDEDHVAVFFLGQESDFTDAEYLALTKYGRIIELPTDWRVQDLFYSLDALMQSAAKDQSREARVLLYYPLAGGPTKFTETPEEELPHLEA